MSQLQTITPRGARPFSTGIVRRPSSGVFNPLDYGNMILRIRGSNAVDDGIGGFLSVPNEATAVDWVGDSTGVQVVNMGSWTALSFLTSAGGPRIQGLLKEAIGFQSCHFFMVLELGSATGVVPMIGGVDSGTPSEWEIYPFLSDSGTGYVGADNSQFLAGDIVPNLDPMLLEWGRDGGNLFMRFNGVNVTSGGGPIGNFGGNLSMTNWQIGLNPFAGNLDSFAMGEVIVYKDAVSDAAAVRAYLTSQYPIV